MRSSPGVSRCVRALLCLAAVGAAGASDEDFAAGYVGEVALEGGAGD